MRLEKIERDTRFGDWDLVIFCEESKVIRLAAGSSWCWLVIPLSPSSTWSCMTPDSARLVRHDKLPRHARAKLEVPDKELSAALFSIYRLSDDWSELIPISP